MAEAEMIAQARRDEEVYSEPRFDIPLDSYALPFKPENTKPTYSGVFGP